MQELVIQGDRAWARNFVQLILFNFDYDHLNCSIKYEMFTVNLLANKEKSIIHKKNKFSSNEQNVN